MKYTAKEFLNLNDTAQETELKHMSLDDILVLEKSLDRYEAIMTYKRRLSARDVASKLEKLYLRCKNQWVSIQDLYTHIGYGTDSDIAIVNFINQPDVSCKLVFGTKLLRTK